MFDGGEGLSAAVAGRGIAVDFGRGIEVVALEAVGADDVFEVHHGTQGDHLSRGVAGFKRADIRCLGAEGRVGLGHDVPGAAKIVEVVDVESPEVDLKGVEDVGDGDVLLLGFDAVDVGL